MNADLLTALATVNGRAEAILRLLTEIEKTIHGLTFQVKELADDYTTLFRILEDETR